MRKDILKTMSYALVHFSVAFGVVYILTGSVPIATGVALIEPLVNTVAYFFHERAWNFLSESKERASDASLTSHAEAEAT